MATAKTTFAGATNPFTGQPIDLQPSCCTATAPSNYSTSDEGATPSSREACSEPDWGAVNQVIHMTDHELMEAAARDSGRLRPHGNVRLLRPNEELHYDGDSYWFWPAGDSWNPLTNDRDTLRLAVETGRTDLSLLVGKLMLAGECKGLTGMALLRRAVVWDVARYPRKL